MKRARGFTLIEAVLATSLLALGLALAFGILRGATRATSTADAMSQREERLRAVQGLLRTELNAALPIGYAFDGETGEALVLSGDVLEQLLGLSLDGPGRGRLGRRRLRRRTATRPAWP